MDGPRCWTLKTLNFSSPHAFIYTFAFLKARHWKGRSFIFVAPVFDSIKFLLRELKLNYFFKKTNGSYALILLTTFGHFHQIEESAVRSSSWRVIS